MAHHAFVGVKVNQDQRPFANQSNPLDNESLQWDENRARSNAF